jgi:hypothetical protein
MHLPNEVGMASATTKKRNGFRGLSEKRLKEEFDRTLLLFRHNERVLIGLLGPLGALIQPQSPSQLPMAALAAVTLDPKGQRDKSIVKAFIAAGLDHNSPAHWRELLRIFCEVHFGDQRTKPKRDIATLVQVAADYLQIRRKFPKLKGMPFAEKMRRMFPDRYNYDVHHVRKLIRYALDPKNNPILRYPTEPDSLISVLRAEHEGKGLEWTPEVEDFHRRLVSLMDFDLLERTMGK